VVTVDRISPRRCPRTTVGRHLAGSRRLRISRMLLPLLALADIGYINKFLFVFRRSGEFPLRTKVTLHLTLSKIFRGFPTRFTAPPPRDPSWDSFLGLITLLSSFSTVGPPWAFLSMMSPGSTPFFFSVRLREGSHWRGLTAYFTACAHSAPLSLVKNKRKSSFAPSPFPTGSSLVCV